MSASKGLGPRVTRHAGRSSTQGSPPAPAPTLAPTPTPAPPPAPTPAPTPETATDLEEPRATPPRTALDEVMTIEGALLALLVDGGSGMPLERAGDVEALDPEIAAAGSTDVVRSQVRTMQALGMNDRIEDILITATDTYYLARCVNRHEGVFVFLVLDRSRANLAMARHRLGALAETLTI